MQTEGFYCAFGIRPIFLLGITALDEWRLETGNGSVFNPAYDTWLHLHVEGRLGLPDPEFRPKQLDFDDKIVGEYKDERLQYYILYSYCPADLHGSSLDAYRRVVKAFEFSEIVEQSNDQDQSDQTQIVNSSGPSRDRPGTPAKGLKRSLSIDPKLHVFGTASIHGLGNLRVCEEEIELVWASDRWKSNGYDTKGFADDTEAEQQRRQDDPEEHDPVQIRRRWIEQTNIQTQLLDGDEDDASDAVFTFRDLQVQLE